MTIPGLTPEQQELRRTRLTGSTVSAYLGRNRYQSPLEAWEIAMGLAEFEGNEDTAAGNFMEGGIGDFALHKLPIDEETARTATVPGTLVHPEYPDVFAATPDMVLPGERIGVQIKNHLPWVAKTYPGKPQENGRRWDNVAVPEMYLMQCLLEMEVTGKHFGGAWDVWFLASYFGGSHLRIYWILRDTRTINAILDAGHYFWRRHLDPNGPQEPPSPECMCGGCGPGDRWWVGRERPEPPRIKLTPEELAAAPDPFPAQDDEGWGVGRDLF